MIGSDIEKVIISTDNELPDSSSLSPFNSVNQSFNPVESFHCVVVDPGYEVCVFGSVHVEPIGTHVLLDTLHVGDTPRMHILLALLQVHQAPQLIAHLVHTGALSARHRLDRIHKHPVDCQLHRHAFLPQHLHAQNVAIRRRLRRTGQQRFLLFKRSIIFVITFRL